MEEWKGKVAVVTGASAGIGAAIVKDLVNSGMKVVGLARREEKLIEMKNELKGKSGTLYPLKTDITKERDIKEAFKWIKENLGGVDVLINNAGIFIPTLIRDGVVDDWKNTFDLNVHALATCTREALKLMKEDDDYGGYIVIINSMGSHRVPDIPGVAVYCASKFASRVITEGIRRELTAQKSKIRVTSISPGLVKTELSATLDLSDRPHLLPEDIAQGVHYVLSTPPHVQVQELMIRPRGDRT